MLLSLAFIDRWDVNIQVWAAALGWPLEGLLRLSIAAVLGGIIGLEREVRGRQAGFRTNMLVCIGSALVMIVSIHFADHPWRALPGVNINIDPARIAYGVMTGVGFLGAGTIIRHGTAVKGLTTAAGVWCVAAVGLAVGFGMYLLAILATVLIILALWIFDYIEIFLPNRVRRVIRVRTTYRPGCAAEAATVCRNAGIEVHETSFERVADLTVAEVDLLISYRNIAQYEKLEKVIGDFGYELLASKIP